MWQCCCREFNPAPTMARNIDYATPETYRYTNVSPAHRYVVAETDIRHSTQNSTIYSKSLIYIYTIYYFNKH